MLFSYLPSCFNFSGQPGPIGITVYSVYVIHNIVTGPEKQVIFSNLIITLFFKVQKFQ